MSTTLADILSEIAQQASVMDDPVLALLCRMAAKQASKAVAQKKNVSDDKPYQVWSRRGTANYSIMVAGAKAALTAFTELSGDGHKYLVIKDFDGNEIDIEVLKVIVDLEANPTIRLVPR
jgi:hypothetical protein